MMFSEDLFPLVLDQFASEISGRDPPPPRPLTTDSFIARSIMQKAIRRGMTELALRAAATLVSTDRRVLWRRLVVTSLEDLGVGEIDLLVRILAAARHQAWRTSIGGDWKVISHLVMRACAGTRCQSANDLANIARNDPDLDVFKTSLCDAGLEGILAIMTDNEQAAGHRGVAILMALGEDAGPAAPTHIKPDPGAIFSIFAASGARSHDATAYAEAFRRSRLALAPLSLVLRPQANKLQSIANFDDSLPPVSWINDVPTFALDQYTRCGKAAIRSYCRTSDAWAVFARKWDLPSSSWSAAAGELLFRAEGALVTNRRAWPTGLELYERSLRLGCFMPKSAVPEGLALLRDQLPIIDELRARHFPF